jgi:hypothetical protein
MTFLCLPSEALTEPSRSSKPAAPATLGIKEPEPLGPSRNDYAVYYPMSMPLLRHICY